MKKNSFKAALLTGILAFIVSLIIFFTAIFAWFKVTASNTNNNKPSNVIVEQEDKGVIEEKLSVPRKTNFLLAGVDKTELLSDVMIVGSFDSKTCVVTLISIPRDTYVSKNNIDEDLLAEMKEDNIYLPSRFKLNELSSYCGGHEKGIYYLENYLSDMLNVEIDYYATVDTKAFRDIVDAVGGIDMEIRPQGYYYYDPTQDLLIDIPGGYQHLDGEMAEGLVRFRADYVQGDIDRIDIQQEFMKEFFIQVLNKDVLSENGIAILKTCISYMDTDFDFTEAPKYLQFVSELNENSISLVTMPGSAKMIDGLSYYLIDEEEMQKLVNTVFYGNGLPTVDEDLLDLSIQILNGSDVSMLATEKKTELESVGYTVKSVGDSTDEKVPETIIYAKEGIDTTALESFFTSPVHEIDEEKTSNYDIVVVLGTSEQ